MARLTIVQHAGDYREAHDRFAAGGAATYQAQRYSVNFVGELARHHDQVAVVCCMTDEAYDEVLLNGVRAVGAGFKGSVDNAGLVDAVAATSPTHVVVTTPNPALLRWTVAAKLPTICVLADSFSKRGVRNRLRIWRVARNLNSAQIEWVGNHGLNACLSLSSIGVSSSKIVPWDWPSSFSPHNATARTRQIGPLRLCYVGAVNEEKGVGDLIDAIAILRTRGINVVAEINGFDRDRSMARRAAAAGLLDGPVCFVGPIPNEQVPESMRAADAVVVPSRHTYPEGMPLTIYEALSVRTPILASDHPMFKGVLVNSESASIFRAARPDDMADAIENLGNDTELYARLSQNALATWEKLQLPVVWGEMIRRWLEDGAEGRDWLAAQCLASGPYDSILAERRAALGR